MIGKSQHAALTLHKADSIHPFDPAVGHVVNRKIAALEHPACLEAEEFHSPLTVAGRPESQRLMRPGLLGVGCVRLIAVYFTILAKHHTTMIFYVQLPS